jgi:hypothetical protein
MFVGAFTIYAVSWAIWLLVSLTKVKKEKVFEKLFRAAQWIPPVASHIAAESQKTLKVVTDKYSNLRRGKTMLKIPDDAWSKPKILDKIKSMEVGCSKYWSEGAAHGGGAVYSAD